MYDLAQTRLPLAVGDEIDLFELFNILWNKKFVILAFTVLVTIVAMAYAFTAKQKWTSVAYVSAPRVEQIKAYLEQRRALARVDGNKTVNTLSLVQNLFSSFIALSSAQNSKRMFLSESRYYKDLAASAEAGNAQRLLMSLAKKSLLVKLPGKDDIAPYYTISFTADTGKDAQRVLGNYIAAINTQTFQLVDSEFSDSLNASILSRQTELDDIGFKLKRAREQEIASLQAALLTADTAGLKDYTVGRSFAGNTVIELSNTHRLFMLGQKLLNAELATAKTTPLIFPSRYYEIKHELDLLEPLLKYQVAPSYSYSYQLAPTLPQTRDAPKRSLIVILGLILGGMLGCGWVLLGEMVRKHKDTNPGLNPVAVFQGRTACAPTRGVATETCT